MTIEQIKQNDYRMDWMAENKGDEYYKLFGDLCLKGYEVQNIIDGLWILFEGVDQ